MFFQCILYNILLFGVIIMIARKSFLIVTSQFFTRFLGWIGLIVLAKLWGGFAPVALGTIGFAMAFIALFNIVADLGFSSAHVKRVSEGKDLGTCLGTFATIKLILTGLMVLVVFAAMFIWKNCSVDNSQMQQQNQCFLFSYFSVFLQIFAI